MRIAERWENGGKIVVIGADAGEVVIKDVQSALDLLIAAKYEHQADRIAIDKGAVADAFFILSTGMAGEILQKFLMNLFHSHEIGIDNAVHFLHSV